MGVNSLPKTVTRQRRDCDLNPGVSAPESSTLTTRLPSHPLTKVAGKYCSERFPWSYIWRRAYINKPAIGSVNRCRTTTNRFAHESCTRPPLQLRPLVD